MRKAACVLIVLVIGAIVLVRRGVPDRDEARSGTVNTVQGSEAKLQAAADEERFFKEVWPVAQTNVFGKLDALGLVNPLGTSSVRVTRIKFAGPEWSRVCFAKLNDKLTLGYHYIKRDELQLEGINLFVEGGNDENGIPNSSDAIITMLQDRRDMPESLKADMKAALANTNLYPRLDIGRATELATKILHALAVRPDEYVLNRQQEQRDWLPHRFFTFDRRNQGNVDPANLAQKDSIFITLRSARDGIHLQHYSSSYHVFEGDAAVHGKRR